MQVSAHNGSVSFVDGKFRLDVEFHRTIRLPEDGKTHSLPPSLGTFPVKRLDDYKDKVPADWVEHGGVFLPMHPREALWLGFHGSTGAIKVAAGKVNAVSGKPWDPILKADSAREDSEQDYMVGPRPQPWLDGFNSGKGVIKQFVGMAMGQGYTVEAQVTGEEKFGGIQVLVCPPKEEYRKKINPPSITRSFGMHVNHLAPRFRSVKAAQIGMAAGGSMKQKIYPDPHGVEVWDQEKSGRLYVHIINAEMYAEITGEQPPAMPQDAQSYGGPYFDLADEGAGDVAASETLAGVKTVSQMDQQHGFEGQQDDSPVDEKGKVHTYPHDVPAGKTAVRNGKW